MAFMYKVHHFSTELSGGAGVAAQRLHKALLEENISTKISSRKGKTSLADVVSDRRYSSILWRNLESIEMRRQWNQSVHERSLFTSPRWIYKTRMKDIAPQASIINLHWISRWIDQPSFFASIPKNLPVVWSLHDMNPLTGGCHHALACDKFTTHCHSCPSLKKSGPCDATWKNFRIKAKAYQDLNLHIVGNSTWTTAQAQRSALMQSAKSFQTIPIGIDTQLYAPIHSQSARVCLRIDPDEFTIGFACADLSDQNKNLLVLLNAIQRLSQHQSSSVTLIVFGSGHLPPLLNSIKVVRLDNLSSPVMQCVAYAAADVFVMPSRIESFGLTALEAMACGTPVVAYRTGGLPDLIDSGQTGLLVDEIGSVEGLQKALQWMQNYPEERDQMGLASRRRVEKHFTDVLMVKRYKSLYDSLVTA
jgi:glycosyltransferase involved in cell wall biosynthesis